jgi:hypothetical protein
MKKHILLPLFLLAILPLFGQRVVEIRNLSANYAATPPTVTFEVFWTTQPVQPYHRDTVWLFVDYQPIHSDNSTGAWAPATITAVAPPIGAGTFVPASLNGRGFYLDGHTVAVPFSSTLTVSLSNDLNGAKFNWCAYVTDYPPNATIGSVAYNLHGTPPFVVNGDTLGAGVRTFAGCITSLTDATGCPGLIPERPAISNFTTSTPAICPGETVTLTATATGATEYSFDGGTTWDTNASQPFSPTTTTTYSLVVRNAALCTTAYATAVTVTVNPTPSITVTATPTALCPGDSAIIEIDSDIATEYSYDDGQNWMSASTFSTGALTASTTYYVAVKTVAGCSASSSTTIGINPLPVPAFVNPPSTYCGDSTITLTATGGTEYCFTYVYNDASHNPYLTGNDDPTNVDCDFVNIACTFTPDDEYTLITPENGSLTVWVKVKNAYGCVDSISTTIIITPPPAFTLVAPQGENPAVQTVSLDQQITTITYSTTETGDVTVVGLPAGVTYTWDNQAQRVNITGASTVLGEHPYTVTATGACGTATTQGVLSVTGDRFRMTTSANSVGISSTFTGTLHINWGDGTSDTYTGNGNKNHTYSGGSSAHTITGQAGTITHLDCHSSTLTALDVTECAGLTNLTCYDNTLNTLDITHNTVLTFLNCSANSLTALDVTHNTELSTLTCSNNKLPALDVAVNTKLSVLRCAANKLDVLNVTTNTGLTVLDCSANSLTALNVTHNTVLTQLQCPTNKLTELDASRNTKLTMLHCNNNLLGTLNVSGCIELSTLNCSNNKLSALNVTQSNKLSRLDCFANLLTALVVGNNPLLTTLQCQDNKLNALVLTSNTALRELNCSSNSLTTLDISANTALQTLGCGDNSLNALNVAPNTALTSLMCHKNQLTTLDVSANTKLTLLYCFNNQLAALNVTNNTLLTDLRVQTNLFDAAALNALFGTLHQNTGTKTVYIRDNPKPPGPDFGTGTSNCSQTIATDKGWTVNSTTIGNQ